MPATLAPSIVGERPAAYGTTMMQLTCHRDQPGAIVAGTWHLGAPDRPAIVMLLDAGTRPATGCRSHRLPLWTAASPLASDPAYGWWVLPSVSCGASTRASAATRWDRERTPSVR
ncbi:MAG: hypothetical protein JWR27_2780 [Aeromicrobium sp.]|nr:hypothetical protein [Aeromicrobium sp.]